MAEQKKGLITRLLEGKEKSEEYARSTLPTNRWQLFWDIFKGNFGKIVKVNLLILLFMLPVIAIVVMRLMLNSANGISYPFGASLGVGYPAYPDVSGLSETLKMRSDLYTYAATAVATCRKVFQKRKKTFRCAVKIKSHFFRRHVRRKKHGLDGGDFRRERFLARRKTQL